MSVKPKVIFNNRYLILDEIGCGGFGCTYLAVDTHMPSKPKCVVKQLTFAKDDPELYELVRTRFQREAAILETLGNLNSQIPRLHACSEENGELYLVQDWIEGESLQDKLDKKGAFGEQEVRDLLARLLPVLHVVHAKNVIHRDIKPSNIMVRKDDGQPFLIDFGAVKEVLTAAAGMYGDDKKTIFIGTRLFAPLEQHNGNPVFASDLYSLGLTAICLLTNQLPAWKETNLLTGKPEVRRLSPGTWYAYASSVSERLKTTLDKAIQPVAAHRFRTAREMLSALRLSRSAATKAKTPPADAAARIATLAKKYNDIRELYKGHDTSHRRELMTGVFSEMVEFSLGEENLDMRPYLSADDWGMRLAAYVYIYTYPRLEDLPALVTSVEQAERQPFVQHRGIEAIGQILERHVHEPEVLEAVKRVRGLLGRLPSGTLRHAALTAILKKLDAAPIWETDEDLKLLD